MAKPSPAARAWIDAFKPACRARKMRFVSDQGFVLDDVYITSVSAGVHHPDRDPQRLRISWMFDVKPLVVDEILWAAFQPDVAMGPQMRINRRVNGAFRVAALLLDRAWVDVSSTEKPDWDLVLDRFDRARAEFTTTYPTAADFVTALDQRSDGIAPSRDLTRTLTALIGAGRHHDAAQMADEAIARGERGSMSSTVDVLKYLAAFAKGPHALADFQASLTPTHHYRVVYEAGTDRSGDLIRRHHRGAFGGDLARMNGSDPWAVVLSAHPPPGAHDDWTTLRYLQAAGTAAAMVVELCQPGGTAIGAASVRSVVGHRDGRRAEQQVHIVLPRMTQIVGSHEIFTADEAAQMFEVFYRTDTVGDDYSLRWVEGYTADGGHLHPEG